MNYNFIPTASFSKSLKALAKKYQSIKSDIKSFQQEFIDNNGCIGTDLGGGYRKIRIAITSKGKGKSGGARIITYDCCVLLDETNVILVDIYDKSEKETMKDYEYKSIVKQFLEDNK